MALDESEVVVVLGIAKGAESVDGGRVLSSCVWDTPLGPLLRGFCLLLFLDGPAWSNGR